MTPMTKAQARVLTDEIQYGITDLESKIVRAWTEGAWSALGYSSWNDYCATEFECGYIKLPRGERMKTVATLANAGMSNRAIGQSLGISNQTVMRDKNKAGAPNGAPDPDRRVTGTDGKSYSAQRKPLPDPKPDVTPVADIKEQNRNSLMDAAIEQAEREEAVFEFEALCQQVSESASEIAAFGYVGIPEQIESIQRANTHLTDAQWAIMGTVTETARQ